MDGIVGQVLAKMDEQTALIVLSDHGFNSFRRAAHVNRWLIENGYMSLKGGDGKEGREIFQDVDWPRTRAYSLGFASLYLNLKGREGEGCVERETDRPVLRPRSAFLQPQNPPGYAGPDGHRADGPPLHGAGSPGAHDRQAIILKQSDDTWQASVSHAQ